MNNIDSIQDFINFRRNSKVEETPGGLWCDRFIRGDTLRHSIVFLIDYISVRYSFIDPSLKSIVGYPLDYYRDGGLEFTMEIYHPEDFSIYAQQIFVRNILFLKSTPPEEHNKYIFTHNYRLKNRQGGYAHLLQQYSVVNSAKDGTPLAFLFNVVDISEWKTTPTIIHRIERINGIKERPYFETILEERYQQDVMHKLSVREREVLKLLSAGYSSGQLADRLHVSIHTINNHRKSIVLKTGCKTIGESLKLAFDRGLIT